MERTRADEQAVVELLDIAAEPVDLGRQGREAVGLVAAQVGDSSEPGFARGQCRHGGDDGRELADVVQVELDAVQRLAGGEDHVSAVALRAPSERLRDATPSIAGLRGRIRPAEDAHRPTADQGGGHERAGVGQVGLDVRVERGDRAGLDHPAVRLCVVDVDTASA